MIENWEQTTKTLDTLLNQVSNVNGTIINEDWRRDIFYNNLFSQINNGRYGHAIYFTNVEISRDFFRYNNKNRIINKPDLILHVKPFISQFKIQLKFVLDESLENLEWYIS